MLVGAVASAINAVAGGGSLISFPALAFGIRLPDKVANATNSVGLSPGNLAGAIGFRNLFAKTGGYLRTLFLPTALGSFAGAWLLLATSPEIFKRIIPVLTLLASLLLFAQPRVKKLVGHGRTLGAPAGIALQFLVSVYGGYFGAGMGIMMLACFAFYIEGTIHELNAVKNWLTLLVNIGCSVVFIAKGLVALWVALWVVLGSLIGGYVAARVSQRIDPDKLRPVIAIYGLAMTAVFGYHGWVK